MERLKAVVLAVLFFGASPLLLSAQGDTLLLPGACHLSPTPGGLILAADEKGNLTLLDSAGKKLWHFSPRRPARVHLLEGWNTLRPFAFYRDFQEYQILDRFLLSDGAVALDPEKTGYARLVAPAQDGNLWVLDERSFLLKKMDPASQNTLFVNALDLVLSGKPYDLCFMREFQNQLYVADALGMVLQFDMMGTYRKKLPLTGCRWLGFRGEEILALDGDSVTWFHPQKLQKRRTPLPLPARGAKEAAFFDRCLFWISEKGLHRMSTGQRD
jgi:hypothetical protein